MTPAAHALPVASEHWLARLADPASRTVLGSVDVAGIERVLALRSRMRQAMARLGADLFAAPAARRAVILVWTGVGPASARQRAVARAAAEAVHSRFEMTRGSTLGLALVFVDERTPSANLCDRLRHDLRRVPDGVSVVDGSDVCAHGIREAAMTSRL